MFPGRQGIGGKQRRVRYFALVPSPDGNIFLFRCKAVSGELCKKKENVPVRSGVRVKKGSVRYSAGFRFAPSQM